MRRLAPCSCLAAVLAAALAACGGHSSHDGGTEDAGPDGSVVDGGTDAGHDAGYAPFPVSEWCAVQSGAQCEQQVRCGLLDPAQVPDCVALGERVCDQAAYSEGAAAGRLGYSPQTAADCANGYATAPCNETPPACASVFTGKVPPDGGCLLPQECATGGYCLTYTSTCPHTCYRYSLPGQPCNFWDMQCDPSANRCVTGDAGQLFCLALLDAGQPCLSFSDCLPNLACIQGTCIPTLAEVGQPCDVTQGYPFCDTDAFCRGVSGLDGGLCEADVGLGGTCTGGDCLTGLRCSNQFETGTCVSLGKAGDLCGGFGDCKNLLFCETADSTCATLPGDGGDCSASNFACGLSDYCDFTSLTCQPLRALGQGCSYDESCLSQSCQYGALGDGGYGFRCVAPCSQQDGGF
jgi:hypothetical protein